MSASVRHLPDCGAPAPIAVPQLSQKVPAPRAEASR
jgi:hypothetical protein